MTRGVFGLAVATVYVLATSLLAGIAVGRFVLPALLLPWLLVLGARPLGSRVRSWSVWVGVGGCAFIHAVATWSTGRSLEASIVAWGAPWSLLWASLAALSAVCLCTLFLPRLPRWPVWLSRPLAVTWLLTALIASGVIAARHPLGPDAGAYVGAAQRILAGQVPYLDFPIIYYPASFYLQAALISVFGPSPAVLRLEMRIANLVVVALLGLVIRLRLGVGPVALAWILGGVVWALLPLEGGYYVLEPLVSSLGWAGIAAGTLAARVSGARATAAPRTRAELGWALASGLLAGGAVALKQPGAVFLIVIPALQLDLRRFEPKLLAAQLVGVAAWPAAFFATNPEALVPFLDSTVFRLASYAGGKLAPAEPWPDRLRAFAQLAGLPVAVAVALGACLAQVRKPGRPGTTRLTDAAVLFAGLVVTLPALSRPYRHYHLLTLPFAAFGLACLVRALCSAAHASPRRGMVWRSGLGALVLVVAWPFLDYWSSPVAAFRRGDDERAVAAFIRERSGGAARLLVLPNTPQYYLLVGARPVNDDFAFVDTAARYADARGLALAAAAERLPTFVVDRGGPHAAHCRALLLELGFVSRASLSGLAEYFEPPPPSGSK